MNPNTLRKIKRLEAGESFITSEPGNSMLPLYKSNEKGCLIGNNKGHMNGWTKNVYGLAHKIDQSLKQRKFENLCNI